MARKPKPKREQRSMLRDPVMWITTTGGAAILAIVIWLLFLYHS